MTEDITGVPLDALLVRETYITAACVLTAVFLTAAVVPGHLYSRIPAGSAIRNSRENKRIWKLGLLFVQIGICSLLLTLMCVISAQYGKAVNDKPGYEYRNLLWTPLTGTDHSTHQGIIDDLKAGRLVPILDGWHRASQVNYLACHRSRWNVSYVRIFMNWFAEKFAEKEAGYEKDFADLFGEELLHEYMTS